jgi:ubiquinone/menaquinone biosynthesis C-methylase UbiE
MAGESLSNRLHSDNNMNDEKSKLSDSLWRIYHRPAVPHPWSQHDGNLPWDEPDFSERMLREHLDESHGAASRQTAERTAQIEWLWHKLQLEPGHTLLDVTCGPGLYAVESAKRGVAVTGVDFSPAAIAYARQLAEKQEVDGRCRFYQQDIRQMELPETNFDAVILLYGQLAVFRREEAQAILGDIRQRLKPGGRLCVELLNPEKIDKEKSQWWFTDDTGLWGDAPFLHLGERFWLPEARTSVERYYVIHLESAELTHVELCDQSYQPEEMVGMMRQAGFTAVDTYQAWDRLPLYDADEWVVYLAS